jgi:4-hydroxybenzoate polyprenyltransferase
MSAPARAGRALAGAAGDDRPERVNTLRRYIELARPKGWIKNAIVLFPVIFAQRMDDAGTWGAALVAAAAFCLAASAMYVFNDLRDRHCDRAHPLKRARPLASGAVGPRAAGMEAAVLLGGAVVVAGAAGRGVLTCLATYVALQAAYSLWLKHQILLDVLCIALGFVLRAAAGALAIGVAISPWLVVCTFSVCLFMGFCKRTSEIAAFADAEDAARHRGTLRGYTPQLLGHLMTLSAAVAVLAFLLWATSERTRQHLHTVGLVYTLPLFIYGVFRFAMLSMLGRYGDPTDLLLRDRPLQAAIVLWLGAAAVVTRWGPTLGQWLGGLSAG